jgi:hypothetical protein
MLLIVIPMLIIWAVSGDAFAQTTNTAKTPTPTPSPTPPTPVVTTQPGTGTPAVTTVEPIATTEDLNSQFNQFVTGLIGTGGAVGGGIGALWAKFRGKAKRIDSALRAQDFDQRDLMEIWNSIIIAGKNNPDIAFGKLLAMKAYKNRETSDVTILQAWDKEFAEYDEWFTKRYVENPQ